MMALPAAPAAHHRVEEARMPLSLWLSLAAICAMGAMSPGPSLALVLRHTLGGGRGPGIAAALSHALGVGLYALLTVWGLGALVVGSPALFQAITWGGAAYLAWLGLKALGAGRPDALQARGRATDRRQAAREGMLVALGNPKLILFFVALLSQFVTADMDLLARGIIVLTAMVIDAGWYLLVALGLSHSRVLPWLQARAHWINRLTGVLLILLAMRVMAGPLVG
jgi:threonine/homoserine/homoserine lactone efflux protein